MDCVNVGYCGLLLNALYEMGRSLGAERSENWPQTKSEPETPAALCEINLLSFVQEAGTL